MREFEGHGAHPEAGDGKDKEGRGCGMGGPHGKGGGPRGKGGRGEEETRGRIFGHGDIRLVILLQLCEAPAHGYELIKGIEERLNGAYAPSPGLIYPTLTLLEEMGYIVAAASEDGKRAYSIAEPGREFLKLSKHKVDHVLERMAHVAARQRKANSPELSAAMDTLKEALRQKTSAVEFSVAQGRAIADLLEKAAASIRQL